MQHRKFVGSHHANSYLAGTVIRVNKEPVFVDYVERNTIYYRPVGKTVGNNKALTVPLYHPTINMEPFEIGYINETIKLGTQIKATRLFRVARRGSRIGLCATNSYSPDSNRETLIQSTAFYNNVMNLFPSITEILEDKSRYIVGAFSKRWAIDNTHPIPHLKYVYLDTPVGEVRGKELHLDSNFTYLDKDLESAIK